MPDRQPTPIAYATPASRDNRAASGPVLISATTSWRTVAGAAWLTGVLIAVATAIWAFFDDQQLIGSLGLRMSTAVGQAATLIGLLFGPAVFALTVGALVAVVLFFWTAHRLAWSAVLPVLAGCATVVGLARMGVEIDSLVFAEFTMVVVAQAGLVYAGTKLGRPVARWLTRQLVPPPLRESLITLWN